jgi:threonine/homoserine efflux transporter RhtA
MLSVDGSRPYPKERPVLRPMPNRYGAVFAAVAVAQLLDLATFVPAVAHVGIGAESNPLARSLYLSVGPLGPAALKAAAIAFILLALLRVVRRFPTYALPSAALMIGIGLFGAASNLLFGLLR